MTKEEKYLLIEEFYQKNYKGMVKRYSFRAGSPENAEDVLQTAFANALQYCESFNPEVQELGAWFNTIANNALRLMKRDEKHQGTYVEFDEEYIEPIEMSETDDDSISRINELIKSKEYPWCDAFHLWFNLQFKPKEIGAVLDLTPKQVSDNIYLFRQEAQQLFKEA